VIRVQDVSASYFTPAGPVHALDHVSLTIRDDEVLGIAGESGCGKSTLIKVIYQFVEPPPGSRLGASRRPRAGWTASRSRWTAPRFAAPGGGTSPTSRRAR
jgi:ABC-type glutathione transport system ATPase component